jgi:hypothetical protein
MVDNEIMDAVTPAASVDGYFYEVLTESLEAVHVRATEPAGWYLVSLMGEFTRARLPDAPLALRLAESWHRRPAVRTSGGGDPLCVAGFFAESLSRPVDVDTTSGWAPAPTPSWPGA